MHAERFVAPVDHDALLREVLAEKDVNYLILHDLGTEASRELNLPTARVAEDEIAGRKHVRLEVDNELRRLQYEIEGLEEALEQVQSKACDTRLQQEEARIQLRSQLQTDIGTLGVLTEDVKGFEGSIVDASASTIRIGERLETLQRDVERGTSGIVLVHHFLDFATGEEENIDPIFTSNSLHELIEAAYLLQRLLQIEDAMAMHPDGAKLMQRISSAVEQRLIDEFFFAKERGDVGLMKLCATSLLGFKGKHVHTRYVFECVSSITSRKVFDFPSVDALREELKMLFHDIHAMISKELACIAKVFPSPSTLVSLLLERLFQEVVGSFFDSFLHFKERSDAEYLQILEACYDEALVLVERLRAELLLLPETDSSSLRITLESQFEEVMCQYRKSIMDVILRHLRACSAAFLRQVDSSHQSASPAESISHSLPRHHETELASRLLASFERAHIQSAKLSEVGHNADNTSKIASMLLEVLCGKFIEQVATTYSEKLANGEYSEYLYFLYVATTCVDALDTFFEKQIYPLLEPFPDILKQSINDKSTMMSNIESKLANGLYIVLSSFCAVIARILSMEQRKGDYFPTDETLMSSTMSSRACKAVTKAIRTHHSEIVKYLSGRNIDAYLKALGYTLYEILKNHIKQFVISTGGALLLMKDIGEYMNCIREFNMRDIDLKFESLHHLAAIYAVPRESIPGLIAEDSFLSQLSSEELHQFMSLREDYKPNVRSTPFLH